MTFLKIAAFATASALAMATSSAFAAGNVENGKELATKKYACVSCHGENLNKPIDPSYPKLAGQHADYLAHTLVAYQKSDNALQGRQNAIMAAQAKPLSRQEIEDIAAYAASLPSDLFVKK